MAEVDVVRIWTDGACRGNPGCGGWGAVLRHPDKNGEIYGSEPHLTTNNRMEMMAAIMALELLNRPCMVRIHTDSTYLRDGITRWLPMWKRYEWETAKGTPVKNRDLWLRLEAAIQRHDVQWEWVRGHAGDPNNERADWLANKGADEALEE